MHVVTSRESWTLNSICNGESSGSVYRYPCSEEESVLLVPDFWGLDSTVLRTVLFFAKVISQFNSNDEEVHEV